MSQRPVGAADKACPVALRRALISTSSLLIADDVLRLDGKVIDADVELGPESIRARLVGVATDKGYCFFLTNLPPDVGPR